MDQEIEVKFYLASPDALRQRVIAAGAELVQPRVLERNLRFDTEAMDLRAKAQVLRLRADQTARLTFKGPGQAREGVLERQEIEFEVSDFGAARRFLEALGYRAYTSYEKLRETFLLDGVQVSLDAMPFGFFAELEGPSAGAIRAAADKLGLDWNRRLTASYLDQFEALKARLNLNADALTFEGFRGLTIRAEDLGVLPADAAEGKENR
ncbi:MAG: class IV adenylate cyclase [Chloroflexi bacterium]|jgi:predicted adenylyl cyclase CyaB|nr:class IV adenylate cyclase [Anaerolineaceae bacterium]NLI44769.1 class IV adenylate cyclase [Chloroflexota bacterium]HOE35223.1 class IV adenylate cyclase [Anaerolineaceae bacterium]HOT25555.1 class IV adenylate cyclase [Anaerolineaceae bacterium]HQK03447.1 class IV adenylate cyclase [Anaerolineaceae bacterium]